MKGEQPWRPKALGSCFKAVRVRPGGGRVVWLLAVGPRLVPLPLDPWCPHCTPGVTTCGLGLRAHTPERDRLDLGPGSAASMPCDSGQVAEPLCA